MGANQYTPETKEVRGAWLQAHRTEAWGGRIDLEARPKERLAEFDRWLDQVKTEAKAEGIREAVKAVRGVYDMQCPVKPSDSYIHPSVRIAHKWWETCLGGTLDDLARVAKQIRGS